MSEDISEREILLLSGNLSVGYYYDIDNNLMNTYLDFLNYDNEKWQYIIGMIESKAIFGEYDRTTQRSRAFMFDWLKREAHPLGSIIFNPTTTALGINDCMYYTNMKDIWCIDLRNKTTSVCNQFQNVHNMGCGKVKDTFYGFGCFMKDMQSFLPEVEVISVCESYDTKTGEVKSIAPIPLAEMIRPKWWERKVSACELNGKLYAVYDYCIEKIYVYSPEENRWDVIEVNNAPSVETANLVNCNGKLTCVDGRCIFNIYDFESNEWEIIEHQKGEIEMHIYRVFVMSATVLEYT